MQRQIISIKEGLSDDERKTRPGPNEKLMHRFYEPLHLLSILNGDRGPGETDLPSNPQTRDFKLTWRRFLDDLSWLCDNKHGGETVSSVAAQSLSEGNKYWLVSRHAASFDHLQWVLNELKVHRDGVQTEMRIIWNHIAEESILFSTDKVQNYGRSLKLSLRKARESLGTMNAVIDHDDYESLFTTLDSLIGIEDDPVRLCRGAAEFDKERILGQLIRSNNSAETRSPWASVRHYIGRLSSWFSKCRNLVQTSVRFPQLLEDATCEYIALPHECKLPRGGLKTNLRSALGRMLPADQQHLVEELYDQVRAMRLFDIPNAFFENFTDERLAGRIHAEVYLMEHFYFHKFQFVEQEKYIGCSKPSCYCCSLYIRFHPGNFVMRPAHNNVFVTWIPPLFWDLDQDLKQKHNLHVVNQMNAYIRRDVREEIEHRIPRRQKGPDSTTGVESRSVVSQ